MTQFPLKPDAYDKAKQTELAQKRVGKLQDYQKIFGSELGQRVLRDLCMRHDVFGPVFVVGSPDETAYRCGKRDVIIEICKMLKVDLIRLQGQIKENE